MTSLEGPVARAVRGVRGYVGANAAMLTTAVLGASLFTALILVSANIYEAVANTTGVSLLDQPALDLAISLRSPAGERWVTAFTNLGATPSMVFITLTLAVVMYVVWRRRSVLLLVGVAASGSLIFTSVGKTVVGRARPPFADAVPPYEYAPSLDVYKRQVLLCRRGAHPAAEIPGVLHREVGEPQLVVLLLELLGQRAHPHTPSVGRSPPTLAELGRPPPRVGRAHELGRVGRRRWTPRR